MRDTVGDCGVGLNGVLKTKMLQVAWLTLHNFVRVRTEHTVHESKCLAFQTVKVGEAVQDEEKVSRLEPSSDNE